MNLPRKIPGDANVDDIFNQDDIVQVLQAGKFMTGEFAIWEEGDWNDNGRFDQLELVAALQQSSCAVHSSKLAN